MRCEQDGFASSCAAEQSAASARRRRSAAPQQHAHMPIRSCVPLSGATSDISLYAMTLHSARHTTPCRAYFKETAMLCITALACPPTCVDLAYADILASCVTLCYDLSLRNHGAARLPGSLERQQICCQITSSRFGCYFCTSTLCVLLMMSYVWSADSPVCCPQEGLKELTRGLPSGGTAAPALGVSRRARCVASSLAPAARRSRLRQRFHFICSTRHWD